MVAVPYSQPLDIPLAKVEGARQHLRHLYQEIQGIFDSGPYSAVGEFDPESRQHTVSGLKRLAPLPLIERGVQVGRIVHDCHSALNYVITELVRASGGAQTGGMSPNL